MSFKKTDFEPGQAVVLSELCTDSKFLFKVVAVRQNYLVLTPLNYFPKNQGLYKFTHTTTARFEEIARIIPKGGLNA